MGQARLGGAGLPQPAGRDLDLLGRLLEVHVVHQLREGLGLYNPVLHQLREGYDYMTRSPSMPTPLVWLICNA